jgi:RNase P subunit RPR2
MPCNQTALRCHSFQWTRHTTRGRSTGHTTRVAKRSTIILTCRECKYRIRIRTSDDNPYELLPPKEDQSHAPS